MSRRELGRDEGVGTPVTILNARRPPSREKNLGGKTEELCRSTHKSITQYQELICELYIKQVQ